MARFAQHPKEGYFVLEWLNAYATTIFFTYFYFFMQQDFGFGNRDNLLLSAVAGFVYIFGAWQSGKLAQRRGYFFALRIGFGTMLTALAVGSQLRTARGQCVTMIVWILGMCFSWPSLEALVSEGETRPGLSRMVGLYNVTWSCGAAMAFFTGGALLEKLGRAGLFWVPAGCHLAQLALLSWLGRRSEPVRTAECEVRNPAVRPSLPDEPFLSLPGPEGMAAAPAGVLCLPAVAVAEQRHVSPRQCKAFLRMAWLANPFAYMAMNTLIPLLPSLARKLNLSTTLAGVAGSVWMFARLAAFIGLWRWTGWHYRFRWLVGSYGLMVACFAVILLTPSLWVMIAAELFFGLAVGLIYYSSLFYSMDVGETKGEHGGLHEALIGIGICAGPAVGTSSLRLFPGTPQAGTWAVSGLLVLGLAMLLTCQRRELINNDQ